MKVLLSNIKTHFSHYIALIVLLSVGAASFIFFDKYPQVRLVSVFLTASFYVLWGIIHHYLEGDLHLRIVLEYLAVALLGFLVLWTAINRA